MSWQPTEQDLIKFVVREARTLDEKRYDDWWEMFAEDGYYWVPLKRGQTDRWTHTSLMHEDKLLLKLRVERLKKPRAFSQHPESFCHHVLQTPEVEAMDHAANTYRVRTEYMYTEIRADDKFVTAGTMYYDLRVVDGALKIVLKRVDMLDCEAPLPSIQLFQ